MQFPRFKALTTTDLKTTALSDTTWHMQEDSDLWKCSCLLLQSNYWPSLIGISVSRLRCIILCDVIGQENLSQENMSFFFVYCVHVVTEMVELCKQYHLILYTLLCCCNSWCKIFVTLHCGVVMLLSCELCSCACDENNWKCNNV
jgi:hypothetical protein